MEQLSGVIPVLASPMHEDGSPDHQGYARLLDHIFADPKAPLPGLWVLGSGGENFQMAYRHRVEVTRVVVEHMKGRTTLLVGCSDAVMSEVFRFLDDTADLAIDGYHCLPTDRKLNAAATIDYWTAVADRAPKPLWLYSNPARALEPAVEAVRTMAQHPNVAGMKVGGYNLATIVPIASMNSADFQVIGAGAVNHIVYLGLGVTCCAIGSASSFPRQHAEVHALWEEGKLAEAREKARRMNDVLAQLPQRQNTEESAEEKAVLELLGICRRWVYPPFKPLDDERVAIVRAVLEINGLLTAGRRPAEAS
jgi:4-hydroxy-tetrahydrodipicolinate synthase